MRISTLVSLLGILPGAGFAIPGDPPLFEGEECRGGGCEASLTAQIPGRAVVV